MNALSSHHKPSIFRLFPLLALLLLAYNITLWSGRDFTTETQTSVVRFHLISGAEWVAGLNEAFLIAGLALLFLELFKSTRAGSFSTIEHIFSMLVFIVFIVEFLVVRGAGTSTFLLLGLMSLIDVMAGYAISIAVARKEMNITG